MTDLVSIVIPSRNERFLTKTIKDLLEKATQDIEIIAILDGYYPLQKEIVDDERVHYIHFGKPRGMRAGINAGADISNGKYLMKIDGHCMVEKGFDERLKADCGEDWVVIPRRKRLEPESWTLRDVEKPDMDYMFITCPLTKDDQSWGGSGFSGREWREKNKNPKLKGILIDDCLSFQGSCWFMHKDYFRFLELMDEVGYGEFYKEAQEIGFKCWLSGGRVIRNKKTWYAHLHKGKKYGRGYHLSRGMGDAPNQFTNKWFSEKNWHKQTKSMEWLITKFSPVPTWEGVYNK